VGIAIDTVKVGFVSDEVGFVASAIYNDFEEEI
jgi:hypothetical protein